MALHNTSSRSEPFLRSQWITEFLPFDPIKNSTFAEFEAGEQLHGFLSEYIVKQTDQSYKFTPTENSSKATRILEKLARTAKATASLNDDEKKEFQAVDDDDDDDTPSKVEVSLGLGLHEFTDHEDHRMYAVHQVIGQPVGGYTGKPLVHESLVLFVEGRGKLEVLENFMTFLVTENEKKKDSLFFQIHRYDLCHKYWRVAGKKIARDISTVILPSATWHSVMSDFERFLDEKSISWYFQHGIPYKRSYLFYGVPGSGKTSLIQALAAKYDRNLAFVQPSHPKMTDESFKSCIQSAPANSLIVLEDIDALFNKDRSKKNENCPLTFSGLLNGLDGVGNPDGQIFIMTTNFVDRLDSALIRSGRVDLHIEFPLATDEQLLKMFLLFYPESRDAAALFVERIREYFRDGISMAAVQQHFIQNMFAEDTLILERVKDLGARLDVVAAFDQKEAPLAVDEDTKEKEVADRQ